MFTICQEERRRMRGARPAGEAARRAVTKAAADAEARNVRRDIGSRRWSGAKEAAKKIAAGLAAAHEES